MKEITNSKLMQSHAVPHTHTFFTTNIYGGIKCHAYDNKKLISIAMESKYLS